MVAIRQAVRARIRLRNDWIVAFGGSRGGETSEEQTERQCIAVLDSHASLELHRDKLREACEAAKREIEITIEDAAASQLNGFAVTINSGPRLLLSKILSKLRAALALTAPSPPAETATP